MKAIRKFLKIVGIILWSLLAVIGIFTVVCIAIMNHRADKTGEDQYFSVSPDEKVILKMRGDRLRSAGPYAQDTVVLHMASVPDPDRSAEIRDYFQLDTLYAADAPTWDKALAVARFVATNIPHNNQQVQPEKRNAIALWEYTKNVEPAFNCRLHSIMLYELLSSIGLEARFITCLPMDSNDPDCHVVNHVWLPELGKWAMLDSDMERGNYATDENGIPLSLPEIRERYIQEKPIWYHPAFCSEGDRNPETYYYSYLAKNVYWFSSWETLHYDQEPAGGRDRGRYVHLVPTGFAPFNASPGDIITSDASQFWAAPDFAPASPFRP